jgi:hypothetical protein
MQGCCMANNGRTGECVFHGPYTGFWPSKCVQDCAGFINDARDLYGQLQDYGGVWVSLPMHGGLLARMEDFTTRARLYRSLRVIWPMQGFAPYGRTSLCVRITHARWQDGIILHMHGGCTTNNRCTGVRGFHNLPPMVIQPVAGVKKCVFHDPCRATISLSTEVCVFHGLITVWVQ